MERRVVNGVWVSHKEEGFAQIKMATLQKLCTVSLLFLMDLRSTQSLEHCEGNYFCGEGHCCGLGRCCTYYYEAWWFWVVWFLIALMVGCCFYQQKRLRLRRQQRYRVHSTRSSQRIMVGTSDIRTPDNAAAAATEVSSTPIYDPSKSFHLPTYDEIKDLPNEPPAYDHIYNIPDRLSAAAPVESMMGCSSRSAPGQNTEPPPSYTAVPEEVLSGGTSQEPNPTRIHHTDSQIPTMHNQAACPNCSQNNYIQNTPPDGATASGSPCEADLDLVDTQCGATGVVSIPKTTPISVRSTPVRRLHSVDESAAAGLLNNEVEVDRDEDIPMSHNSASLT